MSPHIVFELDPGGAKNLPALLEAVGIKFTKEPEEKHPMKPPLPAFTSISGQLSSSRGDFPCQLVTCRGKNHFYVTVNDDKATTAALLKDLQDALDGYLIEDDDKPS